MPYFQGLIYTPNCAVCPLQNDIKVLPDGMVPCKIAIVGEAPSTTDKAKGRGFVDPAGDLLWLLAEQAGFKRDEVWATHAMLCMPRTIKLASGAMLGETIVQQMAARHCRARLLAELQYTGANVIIPLGKWAMQAVTQIKDPKIYSYRGGVLEENLTLLSEAVQRGLI